MKMKSRNNIFNDLSQMANGALSAMGSLREEIEVMRRSRQERKQANAGSITTEEFDALVTRVDALASRIMALEAMQKPKPESEKRKKTAKK